MHVSRGSYQRVWCLGALLGLLIEVCAAPKFQLAPAMGADRARRHAQGEALIQFNPAAGNALVADALARGRLNVQRHILTRQMQAAGRPGLTRVQTPVPLLEVLQRLRNHPAILFVEPNWVYQHQVVADDPHLAAGNLWGLYGKNTSPANAFGSEAAAVWEGGHTGSPEIYVGVIDEGIQVDHPDLAANLWVNPFDPADGIDNDGNGYIDDVHGWNFHDDNNEIYDSANDDHGTHVAGTIGAAGNNGRGVVGVNWRVNLICAKFLGPDGGITSDAVQAIDYLVDLKTRHGLNIVVLNNSWSGGGYSQALHAAIIRAAKAGILFVAAAGNGDDNDVALNNDLAATYPGNYDTSTGTILESAADYDAVIAVAAIDASGAKATWSNYGRSKVDLGAPGVFILSTFPDDGYGYYSGTSMATPHVAGAIALYASAHPALSARQIRELLLNAAEATPTASLTETVTGGRLNLKAMFDSPAEPPQPPPNLTANAQDDRIALDWDTAAQAVSYRVKRAVAAGGPYSVIATALTNTAYLDSGLTPGARYYYVVTAVNAFGESAASNEANAAANSQGTTVAAAFVTGVTLGTARNNFSGWVGMRITPGEALTVLELGRFFVSGNSRTHSLKIVDAVTGLDVQNGSVTFSMAGGVAGQFKYGALPAPVTLLAQRPYFIVSQESAGGDWWHDYDTRLETASAASCDGAVYFGSGYPWTTIPNVHRSYVPVNFKYAAATAASHQINPVPVPAPGGTVTGGGSYANGSAVTLTASPNAGYQFVNWTENGNTVSVSAIYTFTATAPRDLAANFSPEPVSHSITTAALPAEGGTTSGGGTFGAGANATVQATASGGFRFANWTENGNSVATSPSYTFTVDGARHLVAHFAPDNGGAEQSFVTSFTPGRVRHDFGGWVGMQITVGPQPITVTALGRAFLAGNSGSHTVKLVRAGDGADVSGGAAEVVMSPGQTGQFKYAALPSPITLEANTRYYLVSREHAWQDMWSDLDTRVVTSPVAACDGAVYFWQSWIKSSGPATAYVPVSFKYTEGASATFNITTAATPLEGGTASGGGTYGSGAQATVSANANPGYRFNNWTENGAEVSTSPTYAFAVAGSRTLVANFISEISTYTVTVSAFPAQGGTAGGGGNYASGATATVTAAPNPGFRFVNWTEDNSAVSDTAAYTFTVNRARNLTANFAEESSTEEFAFVTAAVPGRLRSEGGWVGMRLTVGATPISVTALGRMHAPGNSRQHRVKLIDGRTGNDVVGGATTVTMAGGIAGNFVYAALAAPVTLTAGSTYYLVSEEGWYADTWYGFDTQVTTVPGASCDGAGYVWYGWSSQGGQNSSAGPVNFKFRAAAVSTAASTP